VPDELTLLREIETEAELPSHTEERLRQELLDRCPTPQAQQVSRAARERERQPQEVFLHKRLSRRTTKQSVEHHWTSPAGERVLPVVQTRGCTILRYPKSELTPKECRIQRLRSGEHPDSGDFDPGQLIFIIATMRAEFADR